MDSLTQIVLGAAVGELVLGRKVGNRAMVWGAISGTVPDLDILANLFMHPMEALAVHRGLSHSIFFAVLFPWVMAWMTERYYVKEVFKNRIFNLFLRSIILLLVLGFVNGIAFEIKQGIPWTTLLVTLTVAGLYLVRTYFQKIKGDQPDATYMDWVKLHFWAVFTHPLLDSCTAYGTQLFQPFSDYRVGLNNIAVADPAYTAPFLVFLILASFFATSSLWRKIFNGLGLGVSSAYLIWTFYNKIHINRIFEESYDKHHIEVERYTTGPTILNNVLWYGVAESRDSFYTGFYSLMDKEDEVVEFQSRAKNDQLIEHLNGERHIEIIKWFSNQYYAVEAQSDTSYVIRDMRYGIVDIKDGTPKHESVFSFTVKEGDELEVKPLRNADTRNGDALSYFWQRIQGIK